MADVAYDVDVDYVDVVVVVDGGTFWHVEVGRRGGAIVVETIGGPSAPDYPRVRHIAAAVCPYSHTASYSTWS